ncbi:MAG TPA: Clp protease N-terminal domain-containing protein [Candidatus Acidoferrum sp.]|nr:Clp protease N-terminal domain-containing protein [Candidatus Acidoferrum sp.]
MFERYTERARRVIFFARYEASIYGSPYIETEHLLLGLLREDRGLAKWFPGQHNVAAEIRAEIDKRVSKGDPFGPSVEVPLSGESKQILNLAAESAERLGHRYIETEHLVIGILRVEKSLAAQILFSRGLNPGPIEQQLGKPADERLLHLEAPSAIMTLESFLGGLKSLNAKELTAFFAAQAEFIDVFGKRWSYSEICSGFESLFAPYAKKNATYAIEGKIAETGGLMLGTVLWKNALLASEQRAWMHRMSFVLRAARDNWEILFVQATLVQPSEAANR